MAVDKFPHTEKGIRRTCYPLVPCGDGSFVVKGTEVNSEKWLRIKYFRVFGQPSAGCLDTRIFLLWKHINRHFSRSS